MSVDEKTKLLVDEVKGAIADLTRCEDPETCGCLERYGKAENALDTHLSALLAERDALRASYATVADAIAADSSSPSQLAAIARSIRSERDGLRAENERLRALLERALAFTWHKTGCRSLPEGCECGLRELRAALNP